MRYFAFFAALTPLTSGAAAQDVRVDPSIEIVQTTAVGVSGDGADQSRLEIKPEVQVRFPNGWSTEFALSLEAAGGDTGLGTRATYDSISRPIRITDDIRANIDRAVIAWRSGSTRLRVGKQTYAWGVLDGLQITDRIDPSSRREAIFIDNRPDRLSRWGARAEFDVFEIRWDAAAIIDETADELARQGDEFFVRAPRFRGGLPSGAQLPPVTFDVPSTATFGLRATKEMAMGEIALLGFQGPDTEPIYDLDANGVTLRYPKRSLIGANFQLSSGAQVWRAEIAWVPDQAVNIQDLGLSIDDRNRYLAGVGLDWTFKGGVFVNAQLGVDHIEGPDLVRPNTDVIGTFRIQKSWANDTLTGRLEMINSLMDGDGTMRPSLFWRATDSLSVETGIDWIRGKREGLIGQFGDSDRVWIRLRYSA
ncbi:hypothetical protein BPTFM16_02615 [Altererythrobacter insulae]|nr:hypothetical protein BPTFM16_02615 [Altererythrobacter insulae]